MKKLAKLAQHLDSTVLKIKFTFRDQTSIGYAIVKYYDGSGSWMDYEELVTFEPLSGQRDGARWKVTINESAILFPKDGFTWVYYARNISQAIKRVREVSI